MQKEAQNFVGTADFSMSRDKIDRFNWLKRENWNVTANSFANLCFFRIEVKMVSTAAEIDNLGLNLKKVQEKFMEWTGDTFRRSYLEDKKNHENMMLLNGKGMWAYVYNNGYTAGTTDRISWSYLIQLLSFWRKNITASYMAFCYSQRRWNISKRR